MKAYSLLFSHYCVWLASIPKSSRECGLHCVCYRKKKKDQTQMDHGKVTLNIIAVLSLPMELNCVWKTKT